MLQDTTPACRVSVVIPTLDDTAALAVSLPLVAAQSPFEVVVVDNSPEGTTDPALHALVARHGARLVREAAPGVSAASFAGYDAARGEVIARVDADTHVPAGWVAAVARRFADDPELHAVTGPGTFYDVDGWRARVLARTYRAALFWGLHAAMGTTPLWGSNMAMRASAWRAISPLVERGDPALHDDLEVAFRLGPLARVDFDRDLVVAVEARAFHSRQALTGRVGRTLRSALRGWSVLGPGGRWVCRLSGGRYVDRPDLFPVGPA